MWTSLYRAHSLDAECRQWVSRRRNLVAFYSEPLVSEKILQHVPQLRVQLHLTRDMRMLIHSLNPLDVHMEPATTVQNIRDELARLTPSAVLFSGHAVDSTFIVENERGRPERLKGDELAHILKNAYDENDETPLTFVGLLCCEGEEIAQAIAKDLPNCSIVFWRTIVENEAAQVFTKGLAEYMAKQFATNEPLNAQACFEHACQTFANEGYRFGQPDPTLGADKRNHGIPALMEAGGVIEANGQILSATDVEGDRIEATDTHDTVSHVVRDVIDVADRLHSMSIGQRVASRHHLKSFVSDE